MASAAVPLESPPPAGPNRAARRHPPKQIKVQRAYLGIAEAAVYLDVTPKTVRKLIADRELAAYRIGARLVKVRIADLDAVAKRVNGGDV